LTKREFNSFDKVLITESIPTLIVVIWIEVLKAQLRLPGDLTGLIVTLVY
jgi:hypothetical protein